MYCVLNMGSPLLEVPLYNHLPTIINTQIRTSRDYADGPFLYQTLTIVMDSCMQSDDAITSFDVLNCIP